MAHPAVEAREILKTFPNPGGGIVRAVDRVSVEIADGEFFALLGPSGCGKSTLLRLIAGFERPDAGEILIHGRAMGRTPPYQRPVNMVFQSYALFPHLTVFQNVAFGLEMAGRPKDEIRQRVGDALALVQLPELGERKPGQLSGGQQQRIALARALVNRPEVLLLDEPLGALDLKLRKEMQLELKALQQQVGITFIYVTHDQEEALAMSDRIAVMDHGRILQIGTPTVIYERPSCRFVADFIGEANFLEGHVTRLEGGFGVMRVDGSGEGGGEGAAGNAAIDLEAGGAMVDPMAGGPAIELAGLAQGELAVGQRVTYSIRPEKIQARTEAPTDGSAAIPGDASAPGPPVHRNCLPARIEDVAYIGSDTRVVARVHPALALSVWEQNDFSTLDPEAYFSRGEAVWLTWRPENALLLGD